MSTTIKVDYSCIDGAHFFSGRDVLSQGFCVAHKDLKVAFDEAILGLKLLLSKNHGLHNAHVESEVPFEKFETWIKQVQTPPPPPMKPKVPTVSEVPFKMAA